MPTTTRRPKTTKRPNKARVVRYFQEWLGHRSEVSLINDRVTELRDRMMQDVEAWGEEDEKGSFFLDLPEPVSYEDPKGRVLQYAVLKRERYLTPANPTPDPELAEELLREKGLWLDEKQEKALQNLRAALPYAIITLDVDADAVAKAYLSGLITEAEYDSCLVPQKENFRFIPSES